MIIRKAVEKDLSAINEIYNDAVLNSTATFDVEEKNPADRKKWFENREKQYSVIVAEIDGIVVGWASLNPYSDRLAYAKTCENSLYVAPKYKRQGIGKNLLKASIEMSRENKFHTILSRITKENETSIIMHKKEGFFSVGVMKEVGEKFGRLLDVEILQLIL